MNLIENQQPDIEKIYLYIQDPCGSKYQQKRREKVGNQKLKNPEASTDYSQKTDDVYENLEDYNPRKKSADNISWYDCRYGS